MATLPFEKYFISGIVIKKWHYSNVKLLHESWGNDNITKWHGWPEY